MNRHERRAIKASGVSLFIFFRAGGYWYPIEIPADQLDENIRLNPGTLRVEDMVGNVLWRAETTLHPGAPDHG